MTNYELFIETEKNLEAIACLRSIPKHELERYYTPPEPDYYYPQEFESIIYKRCSGLSFVFYKMIYHAQLESPRLSNIVDLRKNFIFFRQLTRWFNPREFLDRYSEEESVERILENLDFNGSVGLMWREWWEKDLVRKFAETMLRCAAYLNNFSSEDEMLADLKAHNNSRDELISYFVDKGFSVKFSCSFLNAFYPSFDVPHLDSYIKDVMIIRYGRNKKYYNSTEGKIQLIRDTVHTIEDINNTLTSQGENPITLYRFHRMLYLVCTGKFYLHKNSGSKYSFLEKINGCF